MRCWRLVGLLLNVVCFCLPAAGQHRTNVLLGYDAEWRFEDSGYDLRTDWREPAYPDGAWRVGAGTLAYPLSEPLAPVPVAQGARNRTALNLEDEWGYWITTFYFRIHFEVTPPLGNRLLTVTNVLDDGAVFYLNGHEAHRENMPEGIITASTLASAWREADWGAIVFAMGASNLVAGENVLAVEVHQSDYNSSDLVFGLTLSEVVGRAPEMLREPADVVVEESKPFALSVAASGEPIHYQWQYAAEEGSFIDLTNGVNATYTDLSAQAADGGGYRVILSNFAGNTTSRVAQVQVVPDRTGPALISASASSQLPVWHIEVLFSEHVDLNTGRQSANYVLREQTTGTNAGATVLGFPQGPRVVLQTPVLDPAGRYVLTVNRVKDRKTNVIAPESQVPVLFESNQVLVAMNQCWRWSEEDEPLPFEWRTNHLEARLYGEGEAIFYNSIYPFDPCQGSRNTFISMGPSTHYFTTGFELADTVRETRLRIVHLVDDGAVFYLNGTEIARYNMPDGEIDHATLAVEQVPSPGCVTNYLTASNLVGGINMLAVEVHQQRDADVVFALELSGDLPLIWRLPPNVPPDIAFRSEGSRGILSWTGGGWALEQADAITGPWWEIQPMSNPSTNALPTFGSRFWRLHCKQP